MALPLRKYYPLSKAALELNCGVDDLLHFAAIGVLQLCVHINIKRDKGDTAYVSASLSDDLFEQLNCDWNERGLTYITDMNNIEESSSYRSFMLHEADDNDDPDGLIENARGWFGINYTELSSPEFEITQAANVVSLTMLREHFNLKHDKNTPNTEGYSPSIIFFDRERLFSIDDFAITRSELELLRNGGMPILNSMFGNELITQEKISKKVGMKTINSQGAFIKSLLYLMYSDQDMLDSPRKFIDDPESEIVKDFDSKRLKLPAGKTIEAWLKTCDLPIRD
ncbi:hypothetical protein [Rosenbergiella australiborealis]|uniref:hypothetical protein n=1 Tax=Rosenbergiella australiborealis TaxID=1544696 RepID=UPI001F4DCE26|nr:hypothetical protein [Rosenbergiella australiborealis]